MDVGIGVGGVVTFPTSCTAPPITITSCTRRKVSGSVAAARATLVMGPMTTSLIVSGSFSRRRRRISRWAGVLLGVNNVVDSCTAWAAFASDGALVA